MVTRCPELTLHRWQNGLLDELCDAEDDGFSARLLRVTKSEVSGSSDFQRIKAAIDVYRSLICFPAAARPAVKELLLLLGHRFPRVRRESADKLYVALLADDAVLGDHVAAFTAALTEADWDVPVAAARATRNGLLDMLGMPKPKPVKKQLGTAAVKPS